MKIFVASAGALWTPFSRFAAVIGNARVIRYFRLAHLSLQLGADAEGFLRRNAWTTIGIALAVAFALYSVTRRRRAAELL